MTPALPDELRMTRMPSAESALNLMLDSALGSRVLSTNGLTVGLDSPSVGSDGSALDCAFSLALGPAARSGLGSTLGSSFLDGLRVGADVIEASGVCDGMLVNTAGVSFGSADGFEVLGF